METPYDFHFSLSYYTPFDLKYNSIFKFCEIPLLLKFTFHFTLYFESTAYTQKSLFGDEKFTSRIYIESVLPCFWRYPRQVPGNL